MKPDVRMAQLQAPGAGLPAWERWILHKVLRFSASSASKRRGLGFFLHEADRILGCVAGLDVTEGRRKVLIKRVRGMEDSSRHWSAYMVLEHLVIVDTAVAGMLRALAAGHTLTQEVRIENVKPRSEAGPEQIDRFKQAVDTYAKTIDALPDLHTSAQHAHPWFGPLDAQGWHFLAAFHHRIHRQQLQRIKAGL